MYKSKRLVALTPTYLEDVSTHHHSPVEVDDFGEKEWRYSIEGLGVFELAAQLLSDKEQMPFAQ